MALDQDLIKSIDSLKDLGDAQIEAIINLSVKNEGEVIGEKTGKFATDIEADILEATGIDKKDGEKYFNYLKRSAKELKTKIETLESTSATSATEMAALKAKIKVGIDDAAKEQLSQKDKMISDLQSQVKNNEKTMAGLKATHTEELKAKDKNYHQTMVTSKFDSLKEGMRLKVKEEFKPVFDTLFDAAKGKAMSSYAKSGIEKDANGKEVFRFRDEQENIVFDESDNGNPLTIEGSLKMHGLAEILDPGRNQSGAGGGTPKDKQVANIGSAKSKVEANAMIEKTLSQRGILRGTKEHREAYAEMADHNEISKLPLEA